MSLLYVSLNQSYYGVKFYLINCFFLIKIAAFAAVVCATNAGHLLHNAPLVAAHPAPLAYTASAYQPAFYPRHIAAAPAPYVAAAPSPYFAARAPLVAAAPAVAAYSSPLVAAAGPVLPQQL